MSDVWLQIYKDAENCNDDHITAINKQTSPTLPQYETVTEQSLDQIIPEADISPQKNSTNVPGLTVSLQQKESTPGIVETIKLLPVFFRSKYFHSYRR